MWVRWQCDKSALSSIKLMWLSPPERPVLTSPTKRHRAPVMNQDDFVRRVLRWIVLGFYERIEVPTLHKIKEELKENISFNGCIVCLCKILLQIAFKYAEIDGRKFLLEVTQVSFLWEMWQRKQFFHNIIHLDKSWVNQNYTVGECWIDNIPANDWVQPPTGKGNHLIILHAGTRKAFVSNAK